MSRNLPSLRSEMEQIEAKLTKMPSHTCRRKSGHYPLPGCLASQHLVDSPRPAKQTHHVGGPVRVHRSVAATPDQVSANRLSKSVTGAIPGAWHTNIPSLVPTAHWSFPELGVCCTSPIPPHTWPISAISVMGTAWHPVQMGNHLREDQPASLQVLSHRAGSPTRQRKSAGSILRSRPRMDFAPLQLRGTAACSLRFGGPMDVARPKSGGSFSTYKADYCRWKLNQWARAVYIHLPPLTSSYRPLSLLILFHDEPVV